MQLALIHTSPAAIGPLASYYAKHEPSWEVTNLLDDGLLRLFAAGNQDAVERALLSLVERAAGYGAQAALLTCSAVGLALHARLQARSPIPLIKIDAPMARAAVTGARRLGVLVSFAPSLEATVSLLKETAAALQKEIELAPLVCEGAYAAILGGDAAAHDRMLEEGARRLAAQGVELIVLAQVSMAHLRSRLSAALSLPVMSSLETSHAAVREALGL